jgi:post-segregation antitoxin (ccd killing protein)
MEAKLMNTALKQANFQIPEDLLNELRTTVGKSELSKFVSQALKRELQSLRQQTAIDETFGIWKNQEHPELAKGINDFVRTLRKSTRGKRADAANRR